MHATNPTSRLRTLAIFATLGLGLLASGSANAQTPGPVAPAVAPAPVVYPEYDVISGDVFFDSATNQLKLRTDATTDARGQAVASREIALHAPGVGWDKGLPARDVAMLEGGRATIKGFVYGAGVSPNGQLGNGELALEVHEFAPGDSHDFHAGRVSQDGKKLVAPDGREYDLPAHVAKAFLGGKDNPVSEYGRAGWILGPQTLASKKASEPMTDAYALISGREFPAEIAKPKARLVKKALGAKRFKAKGFQTPGFMDVDGNVQNTTDKRGVMAMPYGAELPAGEAYERVYIPVSQFGNVVNGKKARPTSRWRQLKVDRNRTPLAGKPWLVPGQNGRSLPMSTRNATHRPIIVTRAR